VFLKEAKHFYREDAKTAKRQKGRRRRRRRRSIATDEHGKTRKENAQAEERLDLRIREVDEGGGVKVTKARGTNLPGSVIPRESRESMDIKCQDWTSAYAGPPSASSGTGG